MESKIGKKIIIQDKGLRKNSKGKQNKTKQ
jgi:hypothetical protein